MSTFSDFVALVDRYNNLTNVGPDDADRAANMKKALELIANGQRDSAANLIGPYGFRWEIIEELLLDIESSGFSVPSIAS